MGNQMPGALDLESRNLTTVALQGSDYRGVSFELLCAEGDRVLAGAALMRDARRPEILFAAPAAGRVARIERGARRKLLSLQIEVEQDAGVERFETPGTDDPAALRAFMLQSGAWSSLRTRPFGNIPNPDAEPAAIFVTALDAGPQSPEAAAIIDVYFDEFSAAVETLTKISPAPVYVCHAPNHTIGLESERLRCVAFDDALPGAHINALCPIGFAGGEVWQLGYQDVISLGSLLLNGSPWLQRVISLAGSAVKNPRSLLLAPGGAIAELLDGEVLDAPSRIVAGSPLYGRRLASGQNFLPAGQRQITVEAVSEDETGDSSRADGIMIPGERLERIAPPGVFAVPLMRALQLGDAERARELGALELLEEDVAALSRACASGNDYGLLLRKVLDQLEAVR
jgi:Na+-transporting NADH:ubiquinone oxidoreductase subunit A